MEWKKLTKDAFPEDLVRKENLEYDTTCDEIKTRQLTYRGKDTYIILIDCKHEPEGLISPPVITEIGDYEHRHLIFVCHAEHIFNISTETGKVMDEQIRFAYDTPNDYPFIDLDDENLTYCKYTMVKFKDLIDNSSDD